MSYEHIKVPEGDKIAILNGELQVGDKPIVAFIEGDGTGPDIWAASKRVLDAAVEKAYGGKKAFAWMEVYAGDKANEVYGEVVWLPDETIDALNEYLVGIKGPLTTPVGGGIRSINVAIRQRMDLYACVRPVQYFEGGSQPGQKSRAGRHGYLPGKYRGHLRRYRVSRRYGRERQVLEPAKREFS